MSVYQQILDKKKQGQKQFAILLDPDKLSEEKLKVVIGDANENKADYFFLGGSLITNDHLDLCISTIRANSDIPSVLFPGSTLQIKENADALLFLSVISGRNPEMLIGQHVIAAPILKKSELEVISTGYMLIESGRSTSASYMSNTTPIPHDKNDIAACTAMAGEMLGLKLLFMDGGSGARQAISESMIEAVSSQIEVPLIIGGGIKSAEKAAANCRAGADLIVVGNAIEKEPGLIGEISHAIRRIST